MIRKLFIPIVVLIVSFYYFPFHPIFFPEGVNTKMVMAVFGLPILAVSLAKQKSSGIAHNFLVLSAWAMLISLIAFMAIVINNTPDYSYVGYIMSMWVWLSGAYVTVTLIRKVHGEASIVLLCNYVIAVCVMQCFLALAIDQYPVVRNFFDHIQGKQDWLISVDRLYGLGATLDTAGIRFSVAEVMIAYVLSTINLTRNRKHLYIYIVAFLILVIVGNMMARTTSVGAVLALLYLFTKSGLTKMQLAASQRRLWLWFAILIVAAIPITTYFYNTNESFHKSLRFGFEGFFSYFEKGEWEIGSNEKLKTMVVFPETLHTWVIGDGYFLNPASSDPYYTGKITEGYYMDTDIGYLRFIFYFGVFGLLAFSLFILHSGIMAMEKFPRQRAFVWFLLAVHFICWTKVATDIFLVFALLYMINKEENDAYDTRMALPEEV